MHVTNGAVKPEIYIKDLSLKTDAPWLLYKEIDNKLISDIMDQLLSDKKARKAIMALTGVISGDDVIDKKRRIVEQFIKCNWAAMDDKVDLTPNKLNYEFVECVYRGGKCPFKAEGTICIKTKA